MSISEAAARQLLRNLGKSAAEAEALLPARRPPQRQPPAAVDRPAYTFVGTARKGRRMDVTPAHETTLWHFLGRLEQMTTCNRFTLVLRDTSDAQRYVVLTTEQEGAEIATCADLVATLFQRAPLNE